MNWPPLEYFVGPWPEMENVNLFSEKPFAVLVRPKGPGGCDVKSFHTIEEAKGYMDMVLEEMKDRKVAIYAFLNGEWKKVGLIAT